MLYREARLLIVGNQSAKSSRYNFNCFNLKHPWSVVKTGDGQHGKWVLNSHSPDLSHHPVEEELALSHLRPLALHHSGCGGRESAQHMCVRRRRARRRQRGGGVVGTGEFIEGERGEREGGREGDGVAGRAGRSIAVHESSSSSLSVINTSNTEEFIESWSCKCLKTTKTTNLNELIS